METAENIKTQIGQATLVMLGAYNLCGDNNSLTFKFRGSNKANCVKIELNASDLYDVTFYKIRGMNLKETSVNNGLYSDQLHGSIETNTGLYTKF